MANFTDGKAKATEFSRVNAKEFLELETNSNTPDESGQYFIYVDASGVMKFWNGTSSIDISGEVQTATVAITAAEVKALRATPITLVAAPGANKVIELISCKLKLDYGSEVFTETADNLAIKYTDGSGVAVSDTIESTGFIDQSADTMTSAVPVKDAIVTVAGSANKPLVLHNTGDGEIAGNASNDSVLDVYVLYRVIDIA